MSKSAERAQRKCGERARRSRGERDGATLPAFRFGLGSVSGSALRLRLGVGLKFVLGLGLSSDWLCVGARQECPPPFWVDRSYVCVSRHAGVGADCGRVRRGVRLDGRGGHR
eukprot:6064768-Pleurochrysis_carterae.AAC.1